MRPPRLPAVVKDLARAPLRAVGLDLVRRPTQADGEPLRLPADMCYGGFPEVHAAAAPFTMTGLERMFALFQGVRYLVAGRIEGAIVECGVWRGGSMMVAALTLLQLGDAERELWLYDTFAGMPPPGALDADDAGVPAAEFVVPDWCAAPLAEVRANLLGTHYPESRLRFVPGKVEDTIPREVPDRIALLRLDTDWHDSTHHELVHLFPRLAPGGVLIVDDYGYWRGCRLAVDRFLEEQGLNLLLNRIDDGGRLALKPASGPACP